MPGGCRTSSGRLRAAYQAIRLVLAATAVVKIPRLLLRR
jgi:hypothetical protein